LKRTLEIDAKFWLANDYLGRAYFQQRKYEEALAAFQQANVAAPGTPIVIAELACAYAASGKRPEARAALDELIGLSKRRYVPAFVFAVGHQGLGEKDQAFEWLEKAYEERSAVFAYLETEPMFDGLRSDQRAIRLLKSAAPPP
jgi:tetratricopeptide (TPR) repeat protein